jgi:hypothetical protein
MSLEAADGEGSLTLLAVIASLLFLLADRSRARALLDLREGTHPTLLGAMHFASLSNLEGRSAKTMPLPVNLHFSAFLAGQRRASGCEARRATKQIGRYPLPHQKVCE